MLLSKLWNKSKYLTKSLAATTASLIIGLWSFDLQKLSPNTTLTSQTIYDLRVGLTTLFLLILIFLLSCVFVYSFIAVTKNKKSFETELKDTINSIKEAVEKNYTIHQRDNLSPNIRKAMNEEGSKGFDLPKGSLAGRIFDIHLNEVSVYSSIIMETTLSLSVDNGIDFSAPEFTNLFRNMLISHNTEIKNYHNSLITNLFNSGDPAHTETMVEHFNKQANIETRLRCNELFSKLNIKNSSICSDMNLPLWRPIKKEAPEIHTFTEEIAT